MNRPVHSCYLSYWTDNNSVQAYLYRAYLYRASVQASVQSQALYRAGSVQSLCTGLFIARPRQRLYSTGCTVQSKTRLYSTGSVQSLCTGLFVQSCYLSYWTDNNSVQAYSSRVQDKFSVDIKYVRNNFLPTYLDITLCLRHFLPT